jgi:hypothetical protein
MIITRINRDGSTYYQSTIAPGNFVTRADAEAAENRANIEKAAASDRAADKAAGQSTIANYDMGGELNNAPVIAAASDRAADKAAGQSAEASNDIYKEMSATADRRADIAAGNKAAGTNYFDTHRIALGTAKKGDTYTDPYGHKWWLAVNDVWTQHPELVDIGAVKAGAAKAESASPGASQEPSGASKGAGAVKAESASPGAAESVSEPSKALDSKAQGYAAQAYGSLEQLWSYVPNSWRVAGWQQWFDDVPKTDVNQIIDAMRALGSAFQSVGKRSNADEIAAWYEKAIGIPTAELNNVESATEQPLSQSEMYQLWANRDAAHKEADSLNGVNQVTDGLINNSYYTEEAPGKGRLGFAYLPLDTGNQLNGKLASKSKDGSNGWFTWNTDDDNWKEARKQAKEGESRFGSKEPVNPASLYEGKEVK